MSDPEVGQVGAPADHITPYDRLALDEGSLIAALASRTPNEGLVEYFGEALHAELAPAEPIRRLLHQNTTRTKRVVQRLPGA